MLARCRLNSYLNFKYYPRGFCIYTRLCNVKKLNVKLSKEQRLYQHANIFVLMDYPPNKEQIKIID